MPLPKSLTTVTPFSKALALAIFIFFPILGFFLGMAYQESVNNLKIRLLEEKLISLSRSPTPTPTSSFSNGVLADWGDSIFDFKWKRYTDSSLGISFEYPESWEIEKGYNQIFINAPFYKKDSSLIDYVRTDIKIQLNDNSNKLSLDEFVAERADSATIDPSWNKELKKTKIVYVDGIKGLQINHHPPGLGSPHVIETFVKNGQNIYSSRLHSEELPAYLLIYERFLSTLRFSDQNPTPTCIPRPACLDATPRCLIPETRDMCPRATPTPSKGSGQVVCTQEAKLCPDGSYVSRTGPNCEFAACL